MSQAAEALPPRNKEHFTSSLTFGIKVNLWLLLVLTARDIGGAHAAIIVAVALSDECFFPVETHGGQDVVCWSYLCADRSDDNQSRSLG
jgi:hypothetical protein